MSQSTIQYKIDHFPHQSSQNGRWKNVGPGGQDMETLGLEIQSFKNWQKNDLPWNKKLRHCRAINCYTHFEMFIQILFFLRFQKPQGFIIFDGFFAGKLVLWCKACLFLFLFSIIFTGNFMVEFSASEAGTTSHQLHYYVQLECIPS